MARSRAKTGGVALEVRRAILSVNLALETDFLIARRRAKQIAALVGFEQQDQTRIATAVSEIARNAWEYAGGGLVEFSLAPVTMMEGRREARPSLRIVITDRGSGIARLDEIWSGTYKSPNGMGIGLAGARRLVDQLDIVTGPTGTQATLVKMLPRGAAAPQSLSELAAELVNDAPADGSAAKCSPERAEPRVADAA